MTGKNIATIAALLALALAATASMSGSAAQESDEGATRRRSGGGGVESARRVFTVSYGSTREEAEASKAQARQCIWENWRRKRTARCAVVWSNVEGEPTTHDFQLDRGEGGRWQVFLEIKYDCCWHDAPEAKGQKRESAGAHIYRSVERIDVESRRVVAAEADRPPHTYVLRFREDASVSDDAPTLRFL